MNNLATDRVCYKIILSLVISFICFPQTGNALCRVEFDSCPASPAYTANDINRIYLDNGNPSSFVHTDEALCIDTGKRIQNDCQYNLPLMVYFYNSTTLVSQTLLRSYLPPVGPSNLGSGYIALSAVDLQNIIPSVAKTADVSARVNSSEGWPSVVVNGIEYKYDATGSIPSAATAVVPASTTTAPSVATPVPAPPNSIGGNSGISSSIGRGAGS